MYVADLEVINAALRRLPVNMEAAGSVPLEQLLIQTAVHHVVLLTGIKRRSGSIVRSE